MPAPKITETGQIVNVGPVTRSLLTAIAAGTVTGMFSTQYGPRHAEVVPPIEGCQVGHFERGYAPGRGAICTEDVVNLVAAGLAEVERVGDFWMIELYPDHRKMMGVHMARRCNVAVRLTAAGYAAAGLAPVAPAAEVEPEPVAEVVAEPVKPSRPRAPRRPAASAAAIASVLAFNPDQATAVYADEIGYRHSTVTATLRRMIAAGEVVASADFDGTPLYYLTEAARERYTGPRRPWALAA
jgi:hypothetical protein